MKVFISWSGERSKAVALALRDWLPNVLQSIEPWMSAADIDAGTRWLQKLNSELTDTSVGILCLTRGNVNAPWLLYEAGALGKALEWSRVCPYLIDIEPSDVEGPLAQFQSKKATLEGTLELVKAINAVSQNPLPDERLVKAFRHNWPELDATIRAVPPDGKVVASKRGLESMVEETLNLVRTISQTRLAEPPSKNVRSYLGSSRSVMDDILLSMEIASERDRVVKEYGRQLARQMGVPYPSLDGSDLGAQVTLTPPPVDPGQEGGGS